MRLSKNQIIVSFVLAIVSFGLYVSSLPPAILNAEQINELLLALFGAGVSTLFVAAMEYKDQKGKLENELLNIAESLISAVAGLKECTVESIGASAESMALLISYLEEESSNALCKEGSNSPFYTCQSKRNQIIQAIENCQDDECASFASDPCSSSSRYIARAKQNIKNAAASYLACDKTMREMGRHIDEKLEEFSYLTDSLVKIPLLKSITKAKKARSLREFKQAKFEVINALEPALQQVRLFYKEESNYAELLSSLKSAEEEWLKFSGAKDSGREINTFAWKLFESLSDFAALTKSPVAKHYEKPWWP